MMDRESLCENDVDIESEACSNFIPQNWRQTKCQNCFKDTLEHNKGFNGTIDNTEGYLNDQQNDDCFESCGTVYAICVDDQNEINEGSRHLLTSSSTVVDVEQQQQTSYPKKRSEFSKRSRHYHLLRNSKGFIHYCSF